MANRERLGGTDEQVKMIYLKSACHWLCQCPIRLVLATGGGPGAMGKQEVLVHSF